MIYVTTLFIVYCSLFVS